MNVWIYLALVATALWLAHCVCTLRYALSSEWKIWQRLKKYL